MNAITDLLNQSFNTGFASEVTIYPKGDYALRVKQTDDAVTVRSGVNKNGDPYIMLGLQCVVFECGQQTLEALGEHMGYNADDMTFRTSLYIPTDANYIPLRGKNKNIQFGKLLSAVKQNNVQNWNYNHLKGASFIAELGEKAGQNGLMENNLVAFREYK